MKEIFLSVFCLMLIVGCASQRQKPVCAEIEYRLNHTSMSPDQRSWTAEELRQCREEQEEFAKSDSLTNRIKKSIYELYSDSKKDSTAKDSAAAGGSVQTVAGDSLAAVSDSVSETLPDSLAADK